MNVDNVVAWQGPMVYTPRSSNHRPYLEETVQVLGSEQGKDVGYVELGLC